MSKFDRDTLAAIHQIICSALYYGEVPRKALPPTASQVLSEVGIDHYHPIADAILADGGQARHVGRVCQTIAAIHGLDPEAIHGLWDRLDGLDLQEHTRAAMVVWAAQALAEGDIPPSNPTQDLAAIVATHRLIVLLDEVGIGGHKGLTGEASARLPILPGTGKRSPSGGAWDAARAALVDQSLGCTDWVLIPHFVAGSDGLPTEWHIRLCEVGGVGRCELTLGKTTAVEGWAVSLDPRHLPWVQALVAKAAIAACVPDNYLALRVEDVALRSEDKATWLELSGWLCHHLTSPDDF